MAKINKDNILNRSHLLSKRVLDLRGVRERLSITQMTTHSHKHDELLTKLQEFIESKSDKSLKELGEGYSVEILETLNNHQLKALSDVLSKLDYLYEREKYTRGVSFDLHRAYENTYNEYVRALEILEPYFANINMYEIFGVDSVKNAWNAIDEGVIVAGENSFGTPSEADIDLVSAFKMLGTELSYNGRKWVLNKEATNESTFGMRDNARGSYKFSDAEVESLLAGYLNKPLSERRGRITPEGLFQVYNERAKQKIKEFKLNDNETTALNNKLSEFVDTLSTDSEIWKLINLTIPTTVQKYAEKMAYAELSQEMLGDLPKAQDNLQELDKIKKSIDSSAFILNDGETRDLIGRLEKTATSTQERMREQSNFSNLPKLDDVYNNKIAQLLSRKNNMIFQGASGSELTAIDRTISTLTKARDNLHATVVVLKDNIRKNMEGLPRTRESLLMAMGETMSKTWVQFNGEKIEMVDKTTGERMELTGELVDILKKRLEEKKQFENAQNTQNTPNSPREQGDEENKPIEESQSDVEELDNTDEMEMGFVDTYPDIRGFALDFEDGDYAFSDAIHDMLRLNLAEHMFGEGEPLDLAFKKYMEKNPNGTIQEFAEEMYGGENESPLMDAKSVIAGYEKVQFEKHQTDSMPDETKTYVNKVKNDYARNLILMDRALRSFTDDEIARFNDPTTPDAVKRAMVNQKLQSARTKPIFPVPTNAEYLNAMKAHDKGMLGDMLKGAIPAMENVEVNEGKTSPDIANSLKRYLDKLSEVQQQNTQEVNKEEEENNEEIELPKKPKTKKYKEFSKDSTDPGLLKKAMKGLSMDECVKKFLKPLLKELKNVEINMDAYAARKTPIPSKTNENNEAGEHKLTKRENEASSFIPGLTLLTDMLVGKCAEAGIDPTILKEKPEAVPTDIQNIDNVRTLFNMMTMVDDIPNVPEYCEKKNDMDFRDACRQMTKEIAEGKLASREDVQKRLQTEMQKYGIPQDMVSAKIKNGFELLSQDLVIDMLTLSSKVEKTSSNQWCIDIGSRLPEGLDKCKTDAERRQLVGVYVKTKMLNPEAYKKEIGRLITTVNETYAEQLTASDGNVNVGYGNYASVQINDGAENEGM